jgi:hypothetical protein
MPALRPRQGRIVRTTWHLVLATTRASSPADQAPQAARQQVTDDAPPHRQPCTSCGLGGARSPLAQCANGASDDWFARVATRNYVVAYRAWIVSSGYGFYTPSMPATSTRYSLLQEDVEWPNAWDAGRLLGAGLAARERRR